MGVANLVEIAERSAVLSEFWRRLASRRTSALHHHKQPVKNASIK